MKLSRRRVSQGPFATVVTSGSSHRDYRGLRLCGRHDTASAEGVGASLLAIGCAAVANPADEVYLTLRALRVCCQFLADRRQASSYAFGRIKSFNLDSRPFFQPTTSQLNGVPRLSGWQAVWPRRRSMCLGARPRPGRMARTLSVLKTSPAAMSFTTYSDRR